MFISWAAFAVVLSAAFPLWRATRANRRSTLSHPVGWAWGAWVAWALVSLADALDQESARLGRYLGLAMTGCAGVAVLGARRPGVTAWNLVVTGLLAVFVLPVAQGLGELRLDTPFRVFLGGTLVVGLTNYLPTRAGPAVLLAGAGCGLALTETAEEFAGVCVALGAWAALFLLSRPRQAPEVDALWLDFRDRFGVVWGQRVREQMNRAAANAGWPVALGWFGLETTRDVEPSRGGDISREGGGPAEPFFTPPGSAGASPSQASLGPGSAGASPSQASLGPGSAGASPSRDNTSASRSPDPRAVLDTLRALLKRFETDTKENPS